MFISVKKMKLLFLVLVLQSLLHKGQADNYVCTNVDPPTGPPCLIIKLLSICEVNWIITGNFCEQICDRCSQNQIMEQNSLQINDSFIDNQFINQRNQNNITQYWNKNPQNDNTSSNIISQQQKQYFEKNIDENFQTHQADSDNIFDVQILSTTNNNTNNNNISNYDSQTNKQSVEINNISIDTIFNISSLTTQNNTNNTNFNQFSYQFSKNGNGSIDNIIEVQNSSAQNRTHNFITNSAYNDDLTQIYEPVMSIIVVASFFICVIIMSRVFCYFAFCFDKSSPPRDDSYIDQYLEQLPIATMQQRQNQNICCICLSDLIMVSEEYGRAIVLPCDHVFHQDCVVKWMRRKGQNTECPLCGAVIYQDNLDNPIMQYP
eukprot:TRINITY_DN612_c0_g1_i1.p1 TRINITY_DN612_c0_g1~~TRINITY_DN612_c0_g1_i1.p1  ORF type:complete len:376 (-),score=20.68 TRINITY_DN612_c0_g1_i1:3646-4773(-)